MEKYRYETDNFAEFKAVIDFIESFRRGEPKSNSDSDLDVFDEISYAGWFLFDVIAAIGQEDDNFVNITHENLINYENCGKKPFSASSIIGRIGGSTKVAKRLGKNEIFTITHSKNVKIYQIKRRDVDFFWEKIEAWEGEYESWLEQNKFESPLIKKMAAS